MRVLRRIGFAFLVALSFFMTVPALPAAAQSVPATGFYNNNSPYISYSSGWSYANSASYAYAFNGDIQRSSTDYAWVSFRFTGSTITFWFSATQNSGLYDVYIDNVSIETQLAQKDYFIAAPLRRQGRTWTVGNPSFVHTIKIVFHKRYPWSTLDAEVDGFSVNEPASTLALYDTNNAAMFRRWRVTGVGQLLLKRLASTPRILIRTTAIIPGNVSLSVRLRERPVPMTPAQS